MVQLTQSQLNAVLNKGVLFLQFFFDICSDPLIEKLSSDEFKKYGFWWPNEDGVTVQAYADDIFLFANSYEHRLKLVEAVQDFIR
jgi:hypothetical protein